MQELMETKIERYLKAGFLSGCLIGMFLGIAVTYVLLMTVFSRDALLSALVLAMMIREERAKGFFVSFDYTADAQIEIDRFFRKTGKVIIPFTVGEILDEQIAHKLA